MNNQQMNLSNLEQVYSSIRQTESEVVKTLSSFYSHINDMTKTMNADVQHNMKMISNSSSTKNKSESKTGQKEVSKEDGNGVFIEAEKKDLFKTLSGIHASNKKFITTSNENGKKLRTTISDGWMKMKDASSTMWDIAKWGAILTGAIALYPTMKKVWENVAQPVLSEAWKKMEPILMTFWKDHLQPGLNTFWKDHLKPGLEELGNMLIGVITSPTTWKIIGLAIAGVAAVMMAKSAAKYLGKKMIDIALNSLVGLSGPMLLKLGGVGLALGALTFATYKAVDAYNKNKDFKEEKTNKKNKEYLQAQDEVLILQLKKNKSEDDLNQLANLKERAKLLKKERDILKYGEGFFGGMFNSLVGDEEIYAKKRSAIEDKLNQDDLKRRMADKQSLGKDKYDEFKLIFRQLAHDKKLEGQASARFVQQMFDLSIRQGKSIDEIKQYANNNSFKFGGASRSQLEDTHADGPSSSSSSGSASVSSMDTDSSLMSSNMEDMMRFIIKQRQENESYSDYTNVDNLQTKAAKLKTQGELNSYLNRLDAIKTGAHQVVGRSLGLSSDESRMSSGFGDRFLERNGKKVTRHKGYDFLTPNNTQLNAPFDLELLRSNSNKGSMYLRSMQNNQILALHHLNQVLPNKKGLKLKAGDEMGKTGDTNTNAAPHLHMELQTARGKAFNYMEDGASNWRSMVGNPDSPLVSSIMPEKTSSPKLEKKKSPVKEKDPLKALIDKYTGMFASFESLTTGFDMMKSLGLGKTITNIMNDAPADGSQSNNSMSNEYLEQVARNTRPKTESFI